jgi:hypothetical protein
MIKFTIFYDTFAPIISASVSKLTSRFRLIMVAGGISPYHHLRTDDTPSKRIVGTPTSGGSLVWLAWMSPNRNLLYFSGIYTPRV